MSKHGEIKGVTALRLTKHGDDIQLAAMKDGCWWHVVDDNVNSGNFCWIARMDENDWIAKNNDRYFQSYDDSLAKYKPEIVGDLKNG